MEYKTFKQYCIDTKVTSIAKVVKVNANNYAFITVLRGNVAENIYFSKNANAEVVEGMDVKSIANSLFVANTINGDGEARTKLSFKNSYESMEDMFD